MPLSDIFQSLIDGKISIAEWQVESMQLISDAHAFSAAESAGGWANMTQSDWGFAGSLIKKQYEFLDGFAADIETNPQAWLNGRGLMRVELYNQAARGTQEEMTRRFMSFRGWDEEIRILGDVESCDDCLEWGFSPGTAQDDDWSPIGTLPKIGASICRSHCHCHFMYRRMGANGEWEYSEGGE